jgi:hypothetical protein
MAAAEAYVALSHGPNHNRRMAEFELPSVLRGVFFTFRWNKQSLWALPTGVDVLRMTEIEWHLDLPVWSSNPPAPLFDLAPRVVLENPAVHEGHWNRLHAADTTYPLDMFQQSGRWVIMDGYHRLAKLYVDGAESVRVRMHADKLMSVIRAV